MKGAGKKKSMANVRTPGGGTAQIIFPDDRAAGGTLRWPMPTKAEHDHAALKAAVENGKVKVYLES